MNRRHTIDLPKLQTNDVMDIIKHLTNRVRSLRKHARLPVSKLHGREKYSGAELNVLYAGTPSQKAYFRSLYFADEPRETDLGDSFAWSLNRCAAENDCDLVVAVQARTELKLLPRAGFLLPLWVSAEADTSVSPYEISDKSLKADLARVRKNDLRCEHSTSLQDLEFFWERMYVPYIETQHGRQAILGSIDEFRDLITQGKLLITFAIQDGKRVAGGTLTTEGPTPRSRHIGLLNGNESLKQLGVMAAIYIFELDWAFRNGHQRLNLGATRPFFTDGILHYKKKFNISLRNSDHRKVIYINPSIHTNAVTSALLTNPMICIDNHDLVATVFQSDDFDYPQVGSPWLHHGKLMSGLREVKYVRSSEGQKLSENNRTSSIANRKTTSTFAPASEETLRR